MKSLLISTASAVSLLAAFAGSANAQLAEIDAALDGVLAIPGALVDVGAAITIDELGTLLPGAGATLLAGNTALVTAPSTSIAIQAAVPLSIDSALGAGLAAGIGESPNTASVAAVLAAVDVESLGGTNISRDLTQTTVGQIVDQVSQSALVSNNTDVTSIGLNIGSGSFNAVDEASEASVAIGSSTADSAARYAAISVTTPTVGFSDNSVSNDITAAIGGIYQGNIALVTAPMTSIAAQVGVSNTSRDLTQTSVGQIATQISSVGLDATGVASAIKTTVETGE
jgi:hypothetical protein